MRHYRHGAHTKTDLKAHVVWIPKYRKKVLIGPVAVRVRDLIRQIALEHERHIISGKVARDHVHVFLSYRPHQDLSTIMQWLKGISSCVLLQEFAHLRKKFWHFWARGTKVTNNDQGLLNDRRLTEFAYALPRTRWNIGLTQRMGRMSFLGRVNYYGGWYDYDSGFARLYTPSGDIDNGFFGGKPVVDLELTIDAGRRHDGDGGRPERVQHLPGRECARDVGRREVQRVHAMGLQRRLLLRATRVRMGQLVNRVLCQNSALLK